MTTPDWIADNQRKAVALLDDEAADALFTTLETGENDIPLQIQAFYDALYERVVKLAYGPDPDPAAPAGRDHRY